MRAIALPFYVPRNHTSNSAIHFLITLLLMSAPTYAQERESDGDEKSSWGLGVGAVTSQKPYAGVDRETKVIPMIRFENKYVRLQGLGVEVKLPGYVISDTQKLDFSIVARRSLNNGYEENDAPILAGMADRKNGFWAGAKVEWETSLVNVSADWTGDVSGHSDGQKFSLGVNRSWQFGGHLMLIPRLGATWQDARYNDYYFGVRDGEARPGRAAYRAGAGVNIEAGVSAIYLFDKHHSTMLTISADSLSKEIKNSPIVDRSSESRAFLSYIYRF